MLTSPIPHCIRRLRGSVALPMSSRIRFLITAAFVCHLLVVPPLVTSQLPSPAKPKETPTTASNCPLKRNEDGVCALEQEKDGPVYKLQGQAEIHYSGYILRADEVIYNSETGEVVAEGHVVADGGSNDEHLVASRATYRSSGIRTRPIWRSSKRLALWPER